jgi:hypothetical protein
LKHGADVHADNDYAFKLAKEKGQEDVCDLLIKYMK